MLLGGGGGAVGMLLGGGGGAVGMLIGGGGGAVGILLGGGGGGGAGGERSRTGAAGELAAVRLLQAQAVPQVVAGRGACSLGGPWVPLAVAAGKRSPVEEGVPGRLLEAPGRLPGAGAEGGRVPGWKQTTFPSRAEAAVRPVPGAHRCVHPSGSWVVEVAAQVQQQGQQGLVAGAPRASLRIFPRRQTEEEHCTWAVALAEGAVRMVTSIPTTEDSAPAEEALASPVAAAAAAQEAHRGAASSRATREEAVVAGVSQSVRSSPAAAAAAAAEGSVVVAVVLGVTSAAPRGESRL